MRDEINKKPSEDDAANDAEIKEQVRIGLEILKKHAETFRALAQASPKEDTPE
ncbi:MAG: hypothetical protein NVS9B14_15850 [Candidatus Acidiferrum sp.]